jgi:hypothetical protein
MAICMRKLLLLITVVCVLVVFIAPSVDLPDSALRAWQYAHHVMLALAFLAVMLLLAIILDLCWREEELPAARPILCLRPWLCSFLC